VGRLAFGSLVHLRCLDLGAHGYRGQDGADQEGQDGKPGDEKQVEAVSVQNFSLPSVLRLQV
jgi:hypothetical protein